MTQNIKWQSIPDAPGYEASSMGSIRRIGGRHLGQGRNKSGHLTVSVSINGKSCKRYVHRLVLSAFRGMPEAGMFGCHYDDNPANNHLDNLRWGTPKDNGADSKRNGRSGRSLKIRPLDIRDSWSTQHQAAAQKHNLLLQYIKRLAADRAELIAELGQLSSILNEWDSES